MRLPLMLLASFFLSLSPILKDCSAWGCSQGKVSKVVGSQSCFSRVKGTIFFKVYFCPCLNC